MKRKWPFIDLRVVAIQKGMTSPCSAIVNQTEKYKIRYTFSVPSTYYVNTTRLAMLSQKKYTHTEM